jgi:hypothetical protein
MVTTTATEPSIIEAETGADALATRICPVCPHLSVAHDTIGSRYCDATGAGELSRGCVCVGDNR